MSSDEAVPSWEEAGYSDIVSAGTDEGGTLEVSFANGDVLSLPYNRLGLPDSDLGVEVDPDDPGRILVRVLNEPDRELSWVTIRSAGDPAFAQEMRRRDAEEARRIGRRLKALREDRGLSQKIVADTVGMSAPQLSKIESGSFDLRVSTLQSLLRAMSATFGDISGEGVPEASQKLIRLNARKGGIAPEVLDRLFAHLERRRIPDALERLFGWAKTSLDSPPPSGRAEIASVAFKGADYQEAVRSPQLTMAIRLSELICSAFTGPLLQLPRLDVSEIRQSIGSPIEGVTLARLVDWMLEIGIPVIPLVGSKTFHAATWLVDGRPCVVVKQTRDPSVFWLFDIAHELGHLSRGHLTEGWIVDVDEPRPLLGEDKQEAAATSFALDLLLPDHRELLSSVRAESRGNYLRFKGAVESVARKAHLSPGLLGMVAAYELTDIGEAKDRWGSATNLARADGSGRPVVAKALRGHLDLHRLTDLDAAIVTALAGSAESPTAG